MKFKGEGTHEFEFGKVDFKWDMAALTELSELHGLTVRGIVKMFMDPSIRFLSDFLYVGSKRYNTVNGIKSELKREDSILWVEEMGLDGTMAFFEKSFTSALTDEEKKQTRQKAQK